MRTERVPTPQSGDGKQPALTVRIQDASDGTSIVALAGELDLNTIPRMQGPLLEQISQRPAVLIDLSGLSFIDSSAIGILVQAVRGANGTPVRILIASDSQVDRVFSIAGIAEALPVFTEREPALTWTTGTQDRGAEGPNS